MKLNLKAVFDEIGINGIYVGVLSRNNTIYKAEQSGEKLELNTATLAAIHECGAPEHNIPARSFLRKPLIQNREAMLNITNKAIAKALKNQMSVKMALELIALRAKDISVTAINNGLEPGLKPATIKAKGSSKPLIDTGQLKGSIDYEVRS
ncbi:hypothetical protein KDD93_06880 [Campylobacter sp. faydin G-24]|uniref:Uncharacterized protein n=1 Tax=Campylobacter anatolicus TaxID=2829105 RepID=A0ABS5HJ39_9BACT|nr:hypothetical protein [Campylobacter anatolicus]MBR8461481.1 hypothetical protein [Campylobacter anatolicus]MBR8464284.1 hypothetical protein [Campylobacter anatolicus]